MKKMIYILVFFIGIGSAAFMDGACSYFVTRTETRNFLEKITYSNGDVVYKFTDSYNGLTMQVRKHNIVFTGSAGWLYGSRAYSRKRAEELFMAFDMTFQR